MLNRHATNHGTTDYKVEPGLQELREMMYTGKLHIARHNSEFLEQVRAYHRDEDFKINKGRDHLIDALRYGVMVRRLGKARSKCEGIGFGPPPYAGQQRDGGARSGFAIGSANHPGGSFDLFTGK
jgi:hypothetical protein